VTDAKEFVDRFGFAPIADRQLDAAVEVARGLLAWAERTGAAPH